MAQIEIGMDEWVRMAAAATGGQIALLQGYPYTGFARVAGQLELPRPFVAPSAAEWDRYWDIRIFGPDGEWHAWKDGMRRWQDRRFRAERPPQPENMRSYALWGTHVEREHGWSRCWEDRGAQIWAPFPVEERELPLRLNMELIVERDAVNGLAEIVDSVILALERSDHR
jgi:hypothetical protein